MTSKIMQPSPLKIGIAASLLMLCAGLAGVASAQTINLSAGPTTTTLPDGQVVPMWGLFCNDAGSAGASCALAKDPTQFSSTIWAPPVIRVAAGSTLTINLTNNLNFAHYSAPTSLMIVGQVGGGLGDASQRTTMPSPHHAAQGTTWPGTVGAADPGSCSNPDPLAPGAAGTFCPPAQADRVRSFGTEVAAAGQIPVSPQIASGGALQWANLLPGTYLIESGTEPSIQGAMGLYGIVVVTEPMSGGALTAYGTSYDADVPLLFSEIDPVQNAEVAQVVQNAGFSDQTPWDGQVGRCGDVTAPATSHKCYPPAVNYTPVYYAINGVSFDRTNAAASSLAVPAAGTQTNVLLRLVNAGLRMHVPSVVGSKMTLLGEDGNKLPVTGTARIQSEVFLSAGKTYDVAIQPKQSTAGTYDAATLPVYDRALSLSTNNQRDGGMQVYINVAGGATSGAGSPESATVLANDSDKTYYCANGVPLSVTDPSNGLLGGISGANGVALAASPNFVGSVSADNLALRSNGTFTYLAPSSGSCAGGFSYQINGSATHTAAFTECDEANHAASGCAYAGAPVAGQLIFKSNVASRYVSSPPGVLAGVTSNNLGLALTAVPQSSATLTVNADGSFTALNSGASAANCTSAGLSIGPSGAVPAGTMCTSFTYQLQNAQGTPSNTATAYVAFQPASNLSITVRDTLNHVAVTDYRWIIEEDRTFWIDPKCQVNSADPAVRPASCAPLPVESLGYNFHTANMPVVAQGCLGATSCEGGQTSGGASVKCDVGNGICEAGDSKTPLDPSSVYLDPAKRYFISILPGDGVNPTIGGAGGPMQVDPSCDSTTTDCAMRKFDVAKDCGAFDPAQDAWVPGGANAMCGHEMGGAQIAAGQSVVNVSLQEIPLPVAKLSAFVFQDDNPLNGENDAGGGVDVLAPNERGLGGFEIKLLDLAGALGDPTGQPTYDEFNQPLSNSLAGYIDPATGLDACPITARKDHLVGMIPTCPNFESDGKTYSPIAGQVVIDNLYAGLYEVQAYPAADRIARGENWLQTNTLDGGAPHEVFLKPNEPGYFQEFGPGNFHVEIGFANPKIINSRMAGYCASAINNLGPCNHTLTVHVTNNHMSRAPDERTYSSGNYDHYSFTTCYVSIGPADAEDFAFGTCDANGTVTLTGMPAGTFKIAVFDQWNDIMLDGLVGTVTVKPDPTTEIEFPVTQWRTDLSTHSFVDNNANGLPDNGEPGLALVNTNIRYRDGSLGFFNNTDLGGDAGFNEVFPFIDWLVVETSSTRYKPEAVHNVYDAGGAVDCSGTPAPCSDIAAHVASTKELVPLPAALRVPGAVYCNDADCTNHNLLTDPTGGGATGSSAAIVPPEPWGITQGWQGLLGQTSYMEFAMRPFAAHENGGINGHVIYASTRPFDDPSLSLQLSWEPGVPRVKINLYSKSVDGNGNEHMTLVDTTTTTSWDDWAQGFHDDGHGNKIPNMNCPGQDPTSPFFATLKGSKQWLDPSNPKTPLPNDSQFKCYDGWSQLNQVQPAPYDGMYTFPSVTATDPVSGRATASNCTSCVTNPDATDPFRYGGHTTPVAWTAGHGAPMLPPGKYVVEVVVPPGYELVKEEDKNILLGDVYIAPVTQQFAGFGNIYIMPDQAQVGAAYNPNSPGSLNLTNNLGSQTFPRHEGDTGSIEQYWPCVGAERIVPDLNSLFPGAGQAAPFAGASRRLCDRKEVDVTEGAVALAKFYVFSSTHIAGHFTGTITNDFASEFDPFSPQFGEKFSPPNLPVGLRDFNGTEVARVYSDQWGIFNGLYYSTWSVNPPNPTGYAPQMSIACMNDPGPIPDPSGAKDASGNPVMITDPAYSPAYSNFCYEQPFMPGFTSYMDTPVVPTQAFADNYNLPDSEYPDATPAVSAVVNSNGTIPGPWVSTGAGTPGSVQFTLSNVTAGNALGTSGGDTITSIVVGATTITNGTVRCNLSILCVGTNASGQTVRNITMAAAVTASINARTGVTGYSANHPALTATVIVSAPAGIANGTALSYTQSGVTFSPAALAFAGGTSTPPALALTITALGDKVVQNPNFSGPSSTTAPFNQKTITRHYGFGGTPGTVTVGGVPMTGVSWTDATITGTVNASGVPNCAVQQKNAPAAKCGELVITAANGKQSIDAITVTIDGSAPWIVTPTAVTAPTGKSVKDYTSNFGRMGFSPIQTAIDSASPGDLVIVTPGTYRENLIMWKPVRLQGVGAASVTVNADAHPAGKMDQWRRQVNCAFGLTLDGRPNPGDNNFRGLDANNNLYSCPAPMHQRVDRIPLEAIVGWDAAGNGNLAQLLQEPTLMGAYEGAGITVLGRGVRPPACNNPAFGANCHDFWGIKASGGPGAFTDGSVYLGSGTSDCAASTSKVDGTDYGTGNYYCNPSRIDGLSVINSSQGGGGLFVHGWAQNLEIANTRISGNHGTLAGGINLGNGETPGAFVNDGVECGPGLTGANAVLTCPPIPYRSTNGASYGTINNGAIPFQWNTKVHIHHNMIYNNASIGDALFSGTPAGAGAITISAGADDYLIDHNWMAGNLSTGDGGAMQHLGLSFGGNISHNYILFNQSSNPTLPTNGGGLVIEGANIDRQLNGQECGSITDQDCPPGLGQGVGYGIVIDSNLLLGNSADSGSGGGLRLQQVNGSEVIAFPTCPTTITSGSNRCQGGWFDVTVTNNIIANNVAGWDGGGVSLQDSLMVTFANNTVVSNDTTASAGSLFKTLGAVTAASPPPGCDAQTDPTLPQDPSCVGNSAAHGGQPAGLVVMENTPNLIQAIAALGGSGSVTCPAGYGYTGNTGASSNWNDCRKLSKPKMVNDLFWQNRSFAVNIIGMGAGNQSQQNLIAMTPLVNQASTGACPTFPAANYWDIGLRTDDVASGAISKTNNFLTLTNSLYTSVSSVASSVATSSSNVVGSANPVVAQYCNGARVPPENCPSQGGQVNQASCRGYNTPVGASETTSLSQVFAFNGIQPTATVDEGHNWLNLIYGPLTLGRPGLSSATNAELMVASAPVGTAQGAYSLPAGSPAVNKGANAGLPATTAYDFFGNHRAQSTTNQTDIGAVEYGAAGAGTASIAPTSLGFGNVAVGSTSAPQTLTLTAGSASLVVSSISVSASYSRPAGGTCPTTPGFTLTAGNACTFSVVFAPTALGAVSGTVTINANGAVSGSPVPLSGSATKVDLTVTPGPLLQFGDVFVGLSSAAQTVTLTNTSSPAATVTGVSIAGLTGGPFVRPTGAAAGSCSTAATFSLSSGASCTINLVFTPAVLNPVNGLLTVTAGSGYVVGGSPLQLTGNGLLPVAVPSPLAFGDVPTGTSAQLTLTLDNSNNVNSNADFPVSTLTVAGSGYSRVGGTCGNAPFTLNAGATCTIVVRFSAGATPTGAHTGTVTIRGNAGATNLAVVTLTGNSVAATHTASVSPGSVAFGDVIVSTSSATQDLTVMNTGNSTLNGISITGIASPFTRYTGAGLPSGAPNCVGTLAVGASCTIRLQFAPTALGSASATVTVGGAGTSAPQPAVSATLSGNGIAPPAPGIPSNVNATRGAFGGAITAGLSWNAVQYAASYDVQWSTSLASINANTGTVITNASTTTAYTFDGGANGLMANKNVYFRVRAVNTTSSSNWSAVFNSTVR